MNIDVTPYEHSFIVAFLTLTKKVAAEWEQDGDKYVVYIEIDEQKSHKIQDIWEAAGFKFIGSGKKGKHWKLIF